MQRLEVSVEVRPLQWSLGVKGLIMFPKIQPSFQSVNPFSTRVRDGRKCDSTARS